VNTNPEPLWKRVGCGFLNGYMIYHLTMKKLPLRGQNGVPFWGCQARL